MPDVNTTYGELKAYVTQLTERFIDKYIPAVPSMSPADYELDVKAYCILSHAAFEEFIEGIALDLTNYATDQWLNHRKVSDVILTLLCSHGARAFLV